MALIERLGRMYIWRRAMEEDGQCKPEHFALIDRAIASTVDDLIDMGAGATLLAKIREGKR
jgi:hypothetical protein